MIEVEVVLAWPQRVLSCRLQLEEGPPSPMLSRRPHWKAVPIVPPSPCMA